MQRTINDIVKTMHERYKGSSLLPKNRESTRLIIVEACRIIVEMMEKGDSVFLSELGTFEMRWSKGKTIHHPVTGEVYTKPPHYKPHFTINKRIGQKMTRIPYLGSSDDSEVQSEPEVTEEIHQETDSDKKRDT